jgi:hypothetical protein
MARPADNRRQTARNFLAAVHLVASVLGSNDDTP